MQTPRHEQDSHHLLLQSPDELCNPDGSSRCTCGEYRLVPVQPWGGTPGRGNQHNDSVCNYRSTATLQSPFSAFQITTILLSIESLEFPKCNFLLRIPSLDIICVHHSNRNLSLQETKCDPGPQNQSYGSIFGNCDLYIT